MYTSKWAKWINKQSFVRFDSTGFIQLQQLNETQSLIATTNRRWICSYFDSCFHTHDMYSNVKKYQELITCFAFIFGRCPYRIVLLQYMRGRYVNLSLSFSHLICWSHIYPNVYSSSLSECFSCTVFLSVVIGKTNEKLIQTALQFITHNARN